MRQNKATYLSSIGQALQVQYLQLIVNLLPLQVSEKLLSQSTQTGQVVAALMGVVVVVFIHFKEEDEDDDDDEKNFTQLQSARN